MIAGIFLLPEFIFTFGEKELMFKEVKKNYKQVNIKQKYKIKQNEKIGFGRKIVWKDIPPLNKSQIDELLDPGILDYLANNVQIEMNLKEKLEKGN